MRLSAIHLVTSLLSNDPLVTSFQYRCKLQHYQCRCLPLVWYRNSAFRRVIPLIAECCTLHSAIFFSLRIKRIYFLINFTAIAIACALATVSSTSLAMQSCASPLISHSLTSISRKSNGVFEFQDFATLLCAHI